MFVIVVVVVVVVVAVVAVVVVRYCTKWPFHPPILPPHMVWSAVTYGKILSTRPGEAAPIRNNISGECDILTCIP